MTLLVTRLVAAALVGSSGGCGYGSSGGDGDNGSIDECHGEGKGDGVCSGNSIVGGDVDSGGKGVKAVTVAVVVVVAVMTVAVATAAAVETLVVSGGGCSGKGGGSPIDDGGSGEW